MAHSTGTSMRRSKKASLRRYVRQMHVEVHCPICKAVRLLQDMHRHRLAFHSKVSRAAFFAALGAGIKSGALVKKVVRDDGIRSSATQMAQYRAKFRGSVPRGASAGAYGLGKKR